MAYPESTAMPVVIVGDHSGGGGGGGSGSVTAEVKWDADASEPFLIIRVLDAAGAVTDTIYKDLDGTTDHTYPGDDNVEDLPSRVFVASSVTIGAVTPRVGVYGTVGAPIPMWNGETGEAFWALPGSEATGNDVGFGFVTFDGTSTYVPPAGSDLSQLPVRGAAPGKNMTVATSRKTSSGSPHTITAGALSVEILVVTDTVTVTPAGGSATALPAGTAVTIGEQGWGTPTLTLTVTGSGDVLVIENRAS